MICKSSRNCFCISLLFFSIYSCKNILNTYSIQYEGSPEYNSEVLISDSVFAVKNYGIAHSSFIVTDTVSSIWIKGEKKEGVDFTKVVKDYKLIPFKYSNKTETFSNGIELKVTYENSRSFVNIKDGNSIKKVDITIDNASSEPFIELYDITGDNNKELFIITPVSNYWGAKEINISAYEVKID